MKILRSNPDRYFATKGLAGAQALDDQVALRGFANTYAFWAETKGRPPSLFAAVERRYVALQHRALEYHWPPGISCTASDLMRWAYCHYTASQRPTPLWPTAAEVQALCG